MAMRLCREHGQTMSWWDGLDRGDQALMIAELQEREEEERDRQGHLIYMLTRGR